MTKIEKFSATAMAVAAAMALSAPVSAERVQPVRTSQAAGDLTLEIVDMTPRFLAFYRAAADEKDAEKRYALWKEHYGFAAVPPGPAGEVMARLLLESAWPQYAAQLNRLERGAALLGDEPIRTLGQVARLLEAKGPVAMRLVAYVGGFDDNAFAARAQGVPVVHFPIEMPADRRQLILPHEIAHAVHMQLADLSGGWERSIAATLIQEGLAMHVASELVPGRPQSDYVEHQKGWWDQAVAQRKAILEGIRPALAARDSETVYSFTIGDGPAGLQREAYATGWWVIEQLRKEGMSLAQIARVPEDELPALADRAIASMVGR